MTCPSRLLLVAAALLSTALMSLSAQATPVTYEFETGSLDSVQLLALDGSWESCSDCLVDPVAIDSGTITLDSETGEILNLTIILSGTGELDLSGINGLESGTFTGTTYQS